MLLKDKIIIITGVGKGMGYKLALAAAREGAKVAIAARSQAFLDQVVTEIKAAQGEVIAVVTDVTKVDDCENLVAQTLAAFGRIDGLVNSAYYYPEVVPFEEVDLLQWKRAMDVICFGAIYMIRAVLSQMKKQKGGVIVNVSTLSVAKPTINAGGYAIAKAALGQVTRQFGVEFAKYGIRVNQARIGWMMGVPTEDFLKRMVAKGLDREKMLHDIIAQIPIGYMPRDEDCAKTILFLLSDLASVITGATIDVNGGEWVPP